MKTQAGLTDAKAYLWHMLVSLFRFFVFSNIYVSLCVLTFTAKTFLLLYGSNGDVKVNILVFSATLFLYCFHRLYRRNKMLQEERGEERHKWADRHRILFLAITSVAFIAAAVLMFYMPLKVWVILIPVAVLGLGYSLPVVPSKNGWLRLRDISWLKIFWISLAYAWLTTFVPVIYVGHAASLYNPDVLLVFARSFLFVFVLVIPFDIRDMRHDAKNNVKSLPVLIGVAKSIRIVYIFLALFASLVLIQLSYFHLHTKAAIALLFSATEAAIVVPLSKKPRHDFFYPLAIETSMILHWLFIFIAIHFF